MSYNSPLPDSSVRSVTLEYAIPSAALIISVATLLFGIISLQGKATRNDLESLTLKYERLLREVAKLENELKLCEEERSKLYDENLHLMRKLINDEED